VRGQLGRVLFSGSDVDKPLGALSGGEAARLIFCRIVIEKPNLLILDEPTNHLDLESIGALIEGLEAFEGTVLFVSHDRFFVSELASRILEIRAEGPRDFPGTYAEYLERCGDDHLDADAVVLRAKAAKSGASDAEGAGASSWAEQKRKRNRLNALPGQRDRVLGLIEGAEKRQREILETYGQPGFFEKTPSADIERLEGEKTELERKIAAWIRDWEQIEQELAENASP
jgi:ABC-type multidrug transport system ATPase subunit